MVNPLFKRYVSTNPAFTKMTVGYIASNVLEGLSFFALIPFLIYYLEQDYLAAFGWLAVLFILGANSYIVNYLTNVFSYRVTVYDVLDPIFNDIGKKTFQLPLGWFNKKSTALVSHLIKADANTIANIPSMVLPNLIANTVPPITIMVVLFFIEWRLAIIMLVTLIMVLVMWKIMYNVIKDVAAIENKWGNLVGEYVIAFTQLQPVMRASGLAEHGWDVLNNNLAEENVALHKSMMRKSIVTQTCAGIVNLGFAVTVAYGVSLVFAGTLSPMVLIGIAFASSRFVEPLTLSVMFVSEVFKATKALESVSSVTEAPAQQTITTPQDPDVPADSSIVFENVSFGYDDSRKVLHNINLTVPANSITALIGPSGGGKSTMHSLIARFWDTTKGRVLIGGKNVASFKQQDLMDMIAIVFQETYLFNLTIAENLKIAKASATQAELEEAARLARLDKVIARLPNGWDTVVGEAAGLLSGGEKQRVAIARAFLKDAPILLLDEITSSLDGENEREVTKALEELAKNRTVVLIAHRMSTVDTADQIAVVAPDSTGDVQVAPSTIVECGSPEELRAHKGVYSHFVSLGEEA